MCNDVEAMVNEIGDVSSLAAYPTHKGLGWVILLGADHGKGAWRCHTKLYTHSAAYRRRFQDASKFKKHITSHESGARLDQVAHITCKKYHPLVLENTVTADLDAGFATIKSSQLVVLWNSRDECAIAKMLPKQWGALSLVDKDDMCFLSGLDPEHTMSLDIPFDACKIILEIPQLVFLVTGDLAFYADAIGKHASTRHWCIYCTLNYKEWQTNDVSKPGAGWTKEWMDEIREKVVAELPHKAALEQEKASERAAAELIQEEAAAAGVS